ncbi:GNAT family N-acetyltransferase [Rudaeicoccus suwonensis]|uniref:L-amino acid N-acyltransferase YncA n=1 Tax=Rudaeicoccus suwonensis TaxID=657409 RepID=A0A561EBJ6_9MICO|nr:GNAT family N-acetyltransferase [Rudaeicoccus suwonensis]TWE12985.1 L-amino acid N-acyltransferase YncA [Rudaeicoccus suwonensis]
MTLIRTATAADWPAVWPIFQAVVAAGDTYAYPTDLTSDEARRLWLAEAPGATVVAVDDDGAVIGTAKMGPNRPGNGDHVGTASFMVAEAARGHGAGRAMGKYVVQWHRENGYHAIQFNAVVESNAAAVALWQSLGFRIIGTVPEAFRHPTDGLVGLHVMYLRLG